MTSLFRGAYPSPLAATRLRFEALVEQALPEAYSLLIEHIEAGNHVPDAASWLRNMAAALAQKRLQCGVPLTTLPTMAEATADPEATAAPPPRPSARKNLVA